MGRRTGRPDRHPLMRRIALSAAFVAASFVAGLALPLAAAAHPLGNFTINHYAGLAIGVNGLDLDIVIDMAEIPAFQERQTADTDGDGEVSDDEAAAYAATTCQTLASSLHVELDGVAL